MLLRFEASLNGQPFSAIAPEVILRDIAELPSEDDLQTVSRANKEGLRLTMRQRRSLSVRLTFVIRTQDIARRSQIMQDIMAWARSGTILTINTRPGQQLTVTVDKLPTITSALKWTEDCTVTFTAYEKPYWESDTTESATFYLYRDETTGMYGGGNVLRPLGTAGESKVSLSVLNLSGETMNYLHVTCGSTYMELQGISAPAGSMVLIAYDAADMLQIVVDGENAMKTRTAESSDDLLCVPYVDNGIVVTTDCYAQVSASTRGRWL